MQVRLCDVFENNKSYMNMHINGINFSFSFIPLTTYNFSPFSLPSFLLFLLFFSSSPFFYSFPSSLASPSSLSSPSPLLPLLFPPPPSPPPPPSSSLPLSLSSPSLLPLPLPPSLIFALLLGKVAFGSDHWRRYVSLILAPLSITLLELLSFLPSFLSPFFSPPPFFSSSPPLNVYQLHLVWLL